MPLLRTVAMAAVLATVGVLAAAPPAFAAADTAPPVIESVTVSPDAVAVDGLDLVPVTVAVRLTDETGVIESTDSVMTHMPFAILSRVAGGKALDEYVGLKLAAGTSQDGVWSGTTQVPSTFDGQWEVSKVAAGDDANNHLDADPRDTVPAATLDVTGTHLPAVTMKFAPDPLVGDGRLTITGRFYDTDTGEGIPNQPIFFGSDNLCVEYPAEPNGTTAEDGTYQKVLAKGDGSLKCVGILRPSGLQFAPAFIVVTSGFPRFQPVITAQANDTEVAPGTKVTISGTVAPREVHSVQLQQLRNGAWRTLGSALVQDGARFSFETTPATVGTHRYRVVAPNKEAELVGVSATVVVRVTDGDSSGGGGSLPTTGLALPTVLGAAAALLLGGAVLLLVGRRRRS